MFTKMIAVVAVLAGSTVALASDASFDQAQLRQEKPATTTSGAKAEAPSTAAAPCSCSHAHSHS
jgi:hypothetical protein